MSFGKQSASLLGGLSALLASASAFAAQPEPWQLSFQPSATSIMEQTVWLHDVMLMPVITVTTLFVLGLMIWVIIRYNRKANPTPSTTSHNTLIEVVWTVVPILILVVIAVPSFRVLYYQDVIPEDVDMTIKTTAAQFNWTYEYPDHEGIEIISNMKTESQLEPGEPRLLAVDENAKLPAGQTVRVIITSADVIHAFTVPAFGVKKDAIPGRLNEIWFTTPDEPGVYYGQCSELCGSGHAFMPIGIEILPEAEFNVWAQEQIALQGKTPSNQQLAAAN